MDKKELLLFSALFLGCGEEKPAFLEDLPIPKVSIPESKLLEKLEEKVQPQGEECIINISNKFIPELLSLSRDAQQYFSKEGSFYNPFQRERFGIFSSFAHHQKPFEHYVKAIERRGDQEQPIIGTDFVWTTTPETIKNIGNLEAKKKKLEETLSKIKGMIPKNEITIKKIEKDIESTEKEKEATLQRIETVKKIQQVLQWEGFYKGELNGIYSETVPAMAQYQRFHVQRLIVPVLYINEKAEDLPTNGSFNKATRELLNKSFEDYAFEGIRRVLEERVLHARCAGKYPHVIEQPELEILVDRTLKHLNLGSLGGVRDFFATEHQITTLQLDIPERYQQDFMNFEVEVEKWEEDRTKSKLHLYVIENGKRIELFTTKVVVGGKNRKSEKDYDTPEKIFYMKNLLLMPHWNPTESAEREGLEEEQTLPGPFNAFGMMLMPLYNENVPPKDPFGVEQPGYNGYGIHLTAWPYSVERWGVSHGCVRIHPKMSRFFDFVSRYTPHTIALEDFEGREKLKFTHSRGSFIPFEPEHYIKVRICAEECK